MNNIAQFTQDKQVQVSEQQLRSLLEFIKLANEAFLELNALSYAVRDRLDKNTIAHTLMGLALDKSSRLGDECLEEFKFFQECSPELAVKFAEDLVV